MKFANWMMILVVCAAVFFGCSKVTRENYDKIEMGMAYDEVVAIIGEPDTCDAAIGTKKCVWGDDTKNITISFMGEKVMLPAMKGL